MEFTRRDGLMGAGSILTAAVVSGCLGSDGERTDEKTSDHSHDGNHSHDDGNDNDDDRSFDDVGIKSFGVLDRTQDPPEGVAYISEGRWNGNLPPVGVDETLALGALVETDDGKLELGDEYALAIVLTPDAPKGVVDITQEDYHGDYVDVHGVSEGRTEIVFQIWQDDTAVFQTVPIDLQVLEDVDSNHGE